MLVNSVQALVRICNFTRNPGWRPWRGEMRLAWKAILTMAALSGVRTDEFDLCIHFQNVKGPVSAWELSNMGHLLWYYKDVFDLAGLKLKSRQMILPPYKEWG